MPVSGRYSRVDADGRVVCTLCPRFCRMKDGQRGMCFVRQRQGDEIVLTTYGRSSGFVIDPIEKKPLNHFYPGTSALSFGTAGCNLACSFCQNWDISKSREMETLAASASPERLAQACAENKCKSLAYTYNDPVIFLEYAVDVARECRKVGVKNVAVTAGYMTPAARPEFFENMDAVNVDLKAFDEDFYRRLTKAELKPVLETLLYLKNETDIWFEVTTLLIPGHNDSEEELDRASDWFAEHLGPDVPWHFSAFHPDFRMKDVPATPKESLVFARRLALAKGLRYVYTGNVFDDAGDTTWCPGCGAPAIVRNWYEVRSFDLEDGRCKRCKTEIAGVFEDTAGDWGRKRLQVLM